MLYQLKIEPKTTGGFMFITYNPECCDGVIVLKATKDGIEDFGTDSFPRTFVGDSTTRRCSSGQAQGFSVVWSLNTCVPNCATGTIEVTRSVSDQVVNDLIPSPRPIYGG